MIRRWVRADMEKITNVEDLASWPANWNLAARSSSLPLPSSLLSFVRAAMSSYKYAW